MAHKVPLIASLVLGSLFLPAVVMAGRYHGTVIDAETGEPLSDAAVVVVWYKHAFIAFPTGDAPWHFHAARETVTDASGRFAMSAWPGIDWNPLTHLTDPQIAIFKPGYAALGPGQAGFPVRRRFGYDDLDRQLRRGTTIRLPKLTDCHQPGLALDPGDLGMFIGVPHAKIPHLLRLMSSQRTRCGFPAYHLPEGEQ